MSLALLHEMWFHVQCWMGRKLGPLHLQYVGGVVNPTLVLSLKLRTQRSFHVPNDLIRVSFASTLLFLGSDFRRMVYPDLSFLFSLFHTPKMSVSRKVMLAFVSFPITSLVMCFITKRGLDHRGYVHPAKFLYQYETFFTWNLAEILWKTW